MRERGSFPLFRPERLGPPVRSGILSGSPDAKPGLFAACAGVLNVRIVTLEQAGSTNDAAFARVEADEPMPVAVRAIEQSGGRGRRGRAWASPRGGVWLSVAGAWPGVVVPGAVAMRSALAVWEAVVPELGADEADRLRIKWPNDLLLDGMKIAGVLCERRVLGDGSAVAVIGVGINADFDACGLPAGVRTPATTLRSVLGRGIDADAIAGRLVSGLGGVLGKTGSPMEQGEVRALIDRLAFLDEQVRFERVGGGVVDGVLAGLAPDGRAAVRVGEALEWVVAGDVERAGPGPVGGPAGR